MLAADEHVGQRRLTGHRFELGALDGGLGSQQEPLRAQFLDLEFRTFGFEERHRLGAERRQTISIDDARRLDVLGDLLLDVRCVDTTNGTERCRLQLVLQREHGTEQCHALARQLDGRVECTSAVSNASDQENGTRQHCCTRRIIDVRVTSAIRCAAIGQYSKTAPSCWGSTASIFDHSVLAGLLVSYSR